MFRQGNISLARLYQLDGRVSMAIRIMAYRIKKENIGGRY
jgi:hypothetical protein